MERIKVTLANGEVRYAENGAYVVEEWLMGEWQKTGIFPNTKEGYELAKEATEEAEFEARITQYF